MYEMVYKLNLPPLPEILKDDFNLNSLISKNFFGSKIIYYHPSEVFKEEYSNFLDYYWDDLIFFIRSGKQSSIIHRDNLKSPDIMNWGINWVYGDTSMLEYWKFEDVEKENILIDSAGEEVVQISVKNNPYVSYIMPPGAYLVNASVPHRGKNIGDNVRFLVSLRSRRLRNMEDFKTWDSVVEKFKFLF